MATGISVLALAWLIFAMVPCAQAQTDYDKLTSKYRISHCKKRVEAIRDRMGPGMEVMFSNARRMPVYVTKTLMLNAYADGHAITFSPTICETFPDDDQFSVIVGHEIAHNLLGHYQEAVTGQVLGSIGESVFAGLTGIGLGGAGGRAGVMAFSKDREREADYYGLYLAAYAGYDIDGAPELWRTFALETGGGSGGLTHPSSPERSARAMLVVVDVAHKKRDAKPLLPDELPAVEIANIKGPAIKTEERRDE